jgi:ABC-type polysaccharide/polyol phosphate export permease
MIGVATQLSGPPPESLFRPRLNLLGGARDVWRAREVVAVLARRDFVARYKQALLGVAWAIFTPLVLMLVFALFLRRVTRIDTAGAPYALFAYVGLLPWTFFSTAVAQGGTSLVTNNVLLRKIRCPREVFPITSTVVALVDGLIAASVLVVLFVVTGYAPRATSYWVPVLLVVQVAFALGAALLSSALLVYARDLRHALPLLLQLGLFATPVAYGIEAIPGRWQWLASLVNPLVPVIDGYRRAVLWGQAPNGRLLAWGAVGAAALLVGGYAAFKKLEPGIADVA